eukprot:6435484-Ditylum_brightwellii.AAC.1
MLNNSVDGIDSFSTINSLECSETLTNASDSGTQDENVNSDDIEDERLIQYFDNELEDNESESPFVGTFRKQKVTKDEIQAAYQMLVCKTVMKY